MTEQPCPHRNHCTCPLKCNIECFSICALINEEYVAGILAKSDYLELSIFDRATFICDCFGIDCDDADTCHHADLLAKIILTRINIMYARNVYLS